MSEYKGYEYQSSHATDDNRHKGIRVYLYNNCNGKYGFISFGKDFQEYDKSYWNEIIFESIFQHAVNAHLETNEPEFHEYKYSYDFALGLECGFWKWG